MKTKKQILRILLESGISKQRIKTKDFSNLIIRLDLSNCDFSEFNFSNSNFRDSNFRDSDFSYSNFRDSNFRDSDFSYSNFRDSDFRNSNFRNSNFRDSDFRDSDFSYSNFRDSDFRGSDFSYSNFRDSDFRGSDFSYSNFRDSDFRDSDFRGSDFSYSNFRDSDFRGSDFSYSNFRDSDFRGSVINEYSFGLTINCPEEGSFIGYKKAQNLIVVIEIQADSKRSSATTYKCRASKIKVLRIENLDNTLSKLTEVESDYNNYLSDDQKIAYRIGEIIEIKNFDENRFNECSSGIHFFINRKMAVCY